MLYRIKVKTGKKELVRGVSIIGTRHQALESIIAMDNEYKVSTGVCGSVTGNVPVSQIAPRALLRKAEFKSLPRENVRGTIIERPDE